jgi:hypothetical protein
MKSSKYILGITLCLIFVLSISQPAFAGEQTLAFECEEFAMGTWVGEPEGDEWTGTCTLPPGTEFNQCPEGQTQVDYWVEGELIDSVCITGEPGGTGGEEYSHNSGQGGDAPVGLCTQAAGDWRCAYFNEGTCAVNCYIDPHLPTGAKAALPGGVITTLYVNISPDPGGSYSVCFENPDNESLTIYQYLGGVWVALATSTNNPICASSSGDGSFYLGS